MSKQFFSRAARLGLALLLAAIVILPLATPALAGEIIPGNPDAIVPEDVTIEDDLFISGRLVQIDGTVLGDVFAAGQEVIVNGEVDGNLFTSGQLLSVNGEVSDNVIATSYSLELGPAAQVGGNVYYAGFSFRAAQGSQIARNLYTAGYQAALDGAIGRNVTASLGAFQLNGRVDGDVLVEINESGDGSTPPEDFTFYLPGSVVVLPEGLERGLDAFVGGEFEPRINRYAPPSFPDGGDIGASLLGSWVRTRVGDFMALLIAGLIIFHLLPGPARQAVDELRARPFANMGWGLLAALLFPLGILIAIFLVILLALVGGVLSLGELAGTILGIGGVSLAVLWVLFGLLFWIVSKTVFAYLVGTLFFERVSPQSLDGRWAMPLALLVGLLLYELVRAVPLLGGLTALLVILAGVGAILQVLRARWLLPARQTA